MKCEKLTDQHDPSMGQRNKKVMGSIPVEESDFFVVVRYWLTNFFIIARPLQTRC